jgi:hypothetical protein
MHRSGELLGGSVKGLVGPEYAIVTPVTLDVY